MQDSAWTVQLAVRPHAVQPRLNHALHNVFQKVRADGRFRCSTGQTNRTSTKRIRMTIMKHKEEQEQEQEQEQEEEQEEAVVNACTHNIHTYTRLQQCEAALALDAVRAVFATLTRGHHRQQQTWPPVAATVVAVQVFCFPLPETAGCRRCSPRAANRQPSDCTHTHPRPRSAPAAHQSQTQAQQASVVSAH